MYNPFQLTGKTILVTGASSGIGKATAIECSKFGAKLVVTARNEERLKDTLDSLEGEGHIMILADLTVEEDVKNLAMVCPELDGVVNNAGVSSSKPVAFFSQENIEAGFQTNLFAPMILNRWLLKKKKIKRNASIVFTSSIAAFLSTPGNGIYGSSKAALTAYMKYCAKDLSSKGIRANSIHPGMVDTPLIHGEAITEEELLTDLKNYPLGRFGRPEDIAWATIYFLSDASAWITGSTLIVDGGRMIN